MKVGRGWALLGTGLVLAGCAGGAREAPAPTASTDAAAPDWRRMATDPDRARLRGWRDAWLKALPAARSFAPEGVARQGVLFDPDAALPQPTPVPGAYRCRVFKLGSQNGGAHRYTAYPAFDCRIAQEGDVLSFHKHTGSQRPVGLILPDTDRRAVFLGTLVLGDEEAPLDYGRDASRDMVGLIERIGDRRWRMVLPYPRFESIVDVVELVPVG